MARRRVTEQKYKLNSQKQRRLIICIDLTTPLSSPSFTSSTHAATTTCAAHQGRKEGGSHEGAGFSDSLRNTHRLATDVWFVGALHRRASAWSRVAGAFFFFPFPPLTCTSFAFSPRDNSKEVVAARRHYSSSARKVSRTFPPPSAVLVWRPTRSFEPRWRKPRRETLRRKLSFFSATMREKRV